MSSTIINEIWAVPPERLKPKDRLVLLAIASGCSEDRGNRKTSDRAISTLTSWTGYPSPTVRVAIKSLEEGRWMTRTPGIGKTTSTHMIAPIKAESADSRHRMRTVQESDQEWRRERRNGESQRRAPLPPEFEPDLDFALQKGLTLPEAETDVEKFKAHYKANGETRASRRKAWRGWILKVPDFRRNGHQDVGLTKRQRTTLRNLQEAEKAKRMGTE